MGVEGGGGEYDEQDEDDEDEEEVENAGSAAMHPQFRKGILEMARIREAFQGYIKH